MTFFRAARVSVRCPVGFGSRPSTAASWTSESDWIVPEEPTQVLKPFFRTACAARWATARIALLHLADVVLGGRIALAETVGEAHDAEREALGQEHAGAVRDDELGRAAADVDQEEGVVRGRELAPDGEVDQPGLLLAGDHVDPHARALLDRGDELVRVRRLPHRAGRHGPDDLGARAVASVARCSTVEHARPRWPPAKAGRSAASRCRGAPSPSRAARRRGPRLPRRSPRGA